jgi:hypothetical protein
MKITNVKTLKVKEPSKSTSFFNWVLENPQAYDIVLTIGHYFNMFFFSVLLGISVYFRNIVGICIFVPTTIIVWRNAIKYLTLRSKLKELGDTTVAEGGMIDIYKTVFGGKKNGKESSRNTK